MTESGRKGLFPRTACSAETQHGAAARYGRAELISPRVTPTSPPVSCGDPGRTAHRLSHLKDLNGFFFCGFLYILPFCFSSAQDLFFVALWQPK